MSGRIIYSLTEVSSEDPSYPASELLTAKSHLGFQSARFSSYPVEVTLALPALCHVEHIQLMTHNFKIPSKVDILLGSQEGFQYIGSVLFDDNERQHF